MVIYYEVIFAINSLIHITISKIISRFFQVKIKKKRMLLSLIIVNVFAYIYLYNIYILDYLKYFVGYLIIRITIKSEFKKSLLIFLLYYLGNIMIGGFFQSFLIYNRPRLFMLILAIFITSIFLEIIAEIKTIKNKELFYYDIKLFYNDYLFSYKGFLDTGNDLVEPNSNIPIIILKNQILTDKTIKINYYTISGSDYLEAFYCDNFFIKIKNKWIKKEVYIATKDISYEALLNIRMF